MYIYISGRTKWGLFSQAFSVTALTNSEFIETYKHSISVTKRA